MPAVGLDDIMRDRQAESSSLTDIFRGEEWVKQLVHVLRRNAGAVVRDFQKHFAAQAARADPNMTAFLAEAFEGLKRVDEQIEKHLAYLGLHAEEPGIGIVIL